MRRLRLLFAICLAAPALAAAAEAGAPAAGPIFVDAAAASGLDFVHFNGMSGQFYFPEMTGQGGALLDYDGDGDLDAFLVQGTMLGPGKLQDDGKRQPMDVKSGDRVLVGKYSGSEIKIDNDEFVILREDEILAVVNGQ